MEVGQRRPQFRRTRYFSLLSLVGVVLVTARLMRACRALTEHHLVEHETRANAELFRAFANTVWSDYRGFVGAPARSRESLLADPAQARRRDDVLSKMRGLSVARVKIYNTDGITVFSTDEKQVGEDKRTNTGFLQGLAGEAMGSITHRDHFDAFEGALSNRDPIASRAPVRAVPGGPVEGVFGVYSDVTEPLRERHDAQ